VSTPQPVIAQPDLEAWVWANLQQLSGVTSFVYAALGMWPDWVFAYSLQVDARAARKDAARALAETVRQLLAGLPAVAWAEGVICYAQITEGPFWLPDPDGAPRYTQRWEIRVHPPRANWQAAATPPAGAGSGRPLRHPHRRQAASRKAAAP
jgi:hypothetical protein